MACNLLIRSKCRRTGNPAKLWLGISGSGSLACRAGPAQHQDHPGYGDVELSDPEDGGKGDLDLSVGLQPDPIVDGPSRLIG